MARSQPTVDLTVSEGTIKNGTDVIIHDGYGGCRGMVVGYIAHTDAYLCFVGTGNIRAYPAKQVMRHVPKFNSVEEADAWLEGR